MKEELSRATANARRSVALAASRRSEGVRRSELRASKADRTSMAAASSLPLFEDDIASDGDGIRRGASEASFRAVSLSTESEQFVSNTDYSDEDQDDGQKEVEEMARRASSAERIASGADLREEMYWARPLNPCLEFIDTLPFEAFIIFVITLNTYCLAEETDNPDWMWWGYLNGLFLVIYCGEILLRFLYLGLLNSLWFDKDHMWMWYELFLVVLGMADLVVASLSRSNSYGSASGSAAAIAAATHHAASIENTTGLWVLEPLQLQTRRLFVVAADAPAARLLMLSRLCRMFRVIRFVEPLRVRVQLLISMLINTMWWIFATIFIICFISAIILTRMLGHGLVVNEDSPNADQVQKMFRDIPTSLFTLFQLTTVDDWVMIAGPIISMSDQLLVRLCWRCFFIFFITFMSWTLLSLLTAVASEAMISNTSRSKSDEIVRQELLRQGFITFLCSEFMKADKDKNGVLDREEFQVLMSQPSMKQELKYHGISEEDKDLMRLWELFDLDASGELTIEELVDGFSVLQEILATKHVASIGYSLQRFRHKLEQDMGGIEEGVGKLQQQQQEIFQHTLNQQAETQEQWSKVWLQTQDAGGGADKDKL